jgi:hypothetical protein
VETKRLDALPLRFGLGGLAAYRPVREVPDRFDGGEGRRGGRLAIGVVRSKQP